MNRSEILLSYSKGYEDLVEALKEFPEGMWQFKPAPDRWSIHEIIIHMADSETHGYCRARKLISEPGSSVMVYDQDVLAKSTNYHAQSTNEALELFRMLREMTYNILKTLPDEAWNNHILHPDNGRMTMDDWLKVYDDHVKIHIKQMKNNFLEWQKTN